MAARILIKGGTVLDGSGIPAYAADLRLAGGRIIEVGRNLDADRGERVFDAVGRCLDPEFVESVKLAASRQIRLV